MPRGRGSYLWCLGSAVTVIKAGASSMASKYSVSSSSSLASPFEDCTLPVGTKGSRCSVAACPLWNPSSTSVTAVPSVLLLLCPLQHRLPSQPISHQPPFPSTRRGCRAGFQLLKPRMCSPACILPRSRHTRLPCHTQSHLQSVTRPPSQLLLQHHHVCQEIRFGLKQKKKKKSQMFQVLRRQTSWPLGFPATHL